MSEESLFQRIVSTKQYITIKSYLSLQCNIMQIRSDFAMLMSEESPNN
jgi:hypothetical protein